MVDSSFCYVNDNCPIHCITATYNRTLCDEAHYVLCHLDKQRLANSCALGFVSLLWILIFLIGFVGNVCVCVVICKQISVRTQTNYYLFSLACSDLLILIGLPYSVYNEWNMYPDVFGLTVCRIRIAIAETGTYASVLTVVAFSIERYMAICYPFHTAASVNPLKRAVIIISGIWVLSIACSVPLTIDYSLHRYVKYPPGSNNYSELSTVCGNYPGKVFGEFKKVTTTLFFFIPMATLMVMYSQIAICIWKRKKLLKSQELQGQVHSDRTSGQELTTVTVLATVVIAFFICWLPFHIMRLTKLPEMDQETYITLWLLTDTFKYLFSAINPILYNVMSQKYRRAFMEVLRTPSAKYRRSLDKVQMGTITKTSLNSERNS